MAIHVKQKDGKFQLWSTIIDDRLHDEEWITREEALEILVDRAYQRFIEEVIEIDMDFPNGYGDDEERYIYMGKRKFPEWNYQMHLHDKYDEINKKWFELAKKYKLMQEVK